MHARQQHVGGYVRQKLCPGGRAMLIVIAVLVSLSLVGIDLTIKTVSPRRNYDAGRGH